MGYAISGGPYGFSTFSGATKADCIEGLSAALLAVNWEFLEATTAYCIYTPVDSLPGESRNVTFDGRTYSFRATILDSRAGDVLIGATVADCLANLAAAVNHGAGAGTLYSSATPVHATLAASPTATVIRLDAKTAGTAGNNLYCNDGTWGGTCRATADSALNRTAYGGYKLRGTSPQGGGALTVGLWLFDTGYDYALAQFFADYEGGARGFAHPLKCGTGFTYQVVANPCQLFASRPGVRADVKGSSFCGGVPYLTDDPCSELKDGAPPVTECWWSMGDGYGSPFFTTSTPRTNFLLENWPNGNDHLYSLAGDGCLNGMYTGPTTGMGGVRVLCLAGPSEIELLDYLNQVQSKVLLWDDSSLDQEPLLAWGDTTSSPARLRCQIWDAYIDTVPADMETTKSRDGYAWINYTDQGFYGSLFLITGPEGSASGPDSYAY